MKDLAHSLWSIEKHGLPDGISTHWSIHDYESELNSPLSKQWLHGHDAFVLFREIAVASGNIQEIEIMHLAVKDKFQGNGRSMFSLFLKELMSLYPEMNRILLEVSVDNKAAIRLYERFAFKRINLRSAYYRDGSDALVMESLRPFST